MAAALQQLHQRPPHETGATHHQNLHRLRCHCGAIQAPGGSQGPQGNGWPSCSNGTGSICSTTDVAPGGACGGAVSERP